MGTGLERRTHLWLILCLIPVLLHGFEIPEPEEVKYFWSKTKGVAGRSVVLGCGSTLPDVYIWGYTRPGTESNRAVVYNYGQGPKVEPLAEDLGELSITPNTSSLTIKGLPQKAQGLYTCQALYDTDKGAKVSFYSVQLDVLNETEAQ